MVKKTSSTVLWFGVLLSLLPAAGATASEDADRCARVRDLPVVNGKIVTMDPQSSIVSAVSIKGGVFNAVGRVAERDAGPARA